MTKKQSGKRRTGKQPGTPSRTPSSRRPQDRRFPTLTLHNGEGRRGQLEFPEYPGVVVPLTATMANIVLVLQSGWEDNPRTVVDERGFMDVHSMHDAYTARFNTITLGAVSKYVKLLEDRIAEVFAHLDEPPMLIQREAYKGTHLVRAVKIVNLAKKSRPRNNQRKRLGDKFKPKPKTDEQSES